MPMPTGESALPSLTQATRPETCTGCSRPGSRNASSTSVPSGDGVSVAMNIPPSLTFVVNSLKNASTAE